MISFRRRLIAFLLCAGFGCGLSAIITGALAERSTIPPIDFAKGGQIEEITLDVNYGWCNDSSQCRDYKIVFQRRGLGDYYSSATKIWLKGKREDGWLLRTEFDRLAQAIQDRGFFEFRSKYPTDGWCTDCEITNVSVVREGERKKIVTYSADIPSSLWSIQRMIQGMEAQVIWSEH